MKWTIDATSRIRIPFPSRPLDGSAALVHHPCGRDGQWLQLRVGVQERTCHWWPPSDDLRAQLLCPLGVRK
jgi:hypothetical protein